MDEGKLDRLALVAKVFPIKSITRYGNGCYKVNRSCELQEQPNSDNKRGRITKMSNDSLSRLIVVIQSTDVVFSSMITLTYPHEFPLDGEIVKADIHAYTQWIRKRFTSHYLWFLEFQKRGAPHVHVMVEPNELTPKMRIDAGIKWTHRLATSEWLKEFTGDDFDRIRVATMRMAKFNTHSKFWEIITKKDSARRYVTKYAAKSFQKDVPPAYHKVGRFWGASKGVAKRGVTVDVTDEEVRDYLAQYEHVAADWQLIPKFLFNVKDLTLEGREDDDSRHNNGQHSPSDGDSVRLVGPTPQANVQT